MMVTSLKIFSGKIKCKWSEGSNLCEKYFPVKALQRISIKIENLKETGFTTLELALAIKKGWLKCPICKAKVSKRRIIQIEIKLRK